MKIRKAEMKQKNRIRRLGRRPLHRKLPTAHCSLPHVCCLLLSAFCLLGAGCGGVQSSLDPAGPQANEISDVWWLMFFTLSAVFLIVIGVLVAATFRRRSPSSDQTSPETQLDPKHEQRMSRVVMTGVGVTIFILFALLISSFVAGRSLHTLASSGAPALTIDVTGQLWWWQIKYENDLPSQMVTTANEIHIPVGRLIQFKLRSNDVIHSFWVPNLHGKTDLIPGHVASTWMRADRTGVFRGQCAEFCGHQHAHMALIVVVESEEQFKNWYAGQLQSATQPTSTRQARGQQVFLSGPCVMCHRIQGTDAGGAVGPDLTHIASRQTIGAATLENSREHLAKWILDSQSIKPGNRMPPNLLSAEDLESLLDYLQALK